MPDPQKAPHTGVSFVNICEEIDRVITAPYCIASVPVSQPWRTWENALLLFMNQDNGSASVKHQVII